MIFEDNLIQAGEAGGRKAANLVYSAIQHWVQHEAPAIPIESKVVCRVYANVQGLSDVLFRTGVVEDVGVVEQFARGFTRGKTLFDFVDVGPGKDRADEKINGKLCFIPFVTARYPYMHHSGMIAARARLLEGPYSHLVVNLLLHFNFSTSFPLPYILLPSSMYIHCIHF